MEVAAVALGFVDDAGHFAVDDRPAFLAAIARDFKGQEVVCTVQSKRATRSRRANNYYWSVVVKAAHDDTGQDDDSIHAFWCNEFLPNETKRVEFYNVMTGEHLEADVDTRRTSKLTGMPFYDYVENCRQWLIEWRGVTTPDPDPEYWRKRKAAKA